MQVHHIHTHTPKDKCSMPRRGGIHQFGIRGGSNSQRQENVNEVYILPPIENIAHIYMHRFHEIVQQSITTFMLNSVEELGDEEFEKCTDWYGETEYYSHNGKLLKPDQNHKQDDKQFAMKMRTSSWNGRYTMTFITDFPFCQKPINLLHATWVCLEKVKECFTEDILQSAQYIFHSKMKDNMQYMAFLLTDRWIMVDFLIPPNIPGYIDLSLNVKVNRMSYTENSSPKLEFTPERLSSTGLQEWKCIKPTKEERKKKSLMALASSQHSRSQNSAMYKGLDPDLLNKIVSNYDTSHGDIYSVTEIDDIMKAMGDSLSKRKQLPTGASIGVCLRCERIILQ